MITYFKNNDRGYESWLRDNQTGYVFNDFWGANSSYKTLHNARCKLLCSPVSIFRRTDILKVCSADLNELIYWIEKNRGLEGKGYFPCEACHPFNMEEDHDNNARDSKLLETVWL